MQRLIAIGYVVALGVVGLVAACGSEPVSRNPVGPSAPAAGALQVNGPATIAPGQSAQFTAETRLSDGTVKLLVATWRSSNSSMLQVSSSGLATAGQNLGEAFITAQSSPRQSSREVIVVPDGTLRVVGSVRDAESSALGISGARVEVSGTSIAATTDSGGGYRLYGVPPGAEIRVTANGYLPVAQTIQLTTHGTQNFQLALSGPRLTLNGPFTLSIDVEAPCAGSPALPLDLQHRSYQAVVTTTGALVDVLLTEPRFSIRNGVGNRFSGLADASNVRFTLDTFYSYYYFYYPSIAERLSNNTTLVIEGFATTTRTNGGVTGLLSGGIYNYDSRFPAFNTARIGACSSGGIRLSLTPR